MEKQLCLYGSNIAGAVYFMNSFQAVYIVLITKKLSSLPLISATNQETIICLPLNRFGF